MPNLLADEGFVMTLSYADARSHPHLIRVNENYEFTEDPYDEIGESRTVEYLASDPGNARVPSWFNLPVWIGYAVSAAPALLGLLGYGGMGRSRKPRADPMPNSASSNSAELDAIFAH